MAAFFASASSQRLINAAPPITATPFSVAFWVRPTTTGAARTFWSLSDTAGAINYFALGQTAADTWELAQTDDATPISNATGTVVANEWAFIIGRFVSSTSRRVHVLAHSGIVNNASGVTSDTPVGIDTMALGGLIHSAPAQFFDGYIAEWWMTNTDIGFDGAVNMTQAIIMQLAFGGPFSVPHVASNLIEYRSLRKHPISDGDDTNEVYHGGLGRQTWTNVNGVTTGHHPPLPYWYAKPGQVIRNLTI